MGFDRTPAAPAHIHDSQQVNLRVACAILMTVPAVCCIFRFWSRIIRSDAKLWWDDWTLLILLAFNFGENIIVLVQTSNGLGLHIAAVSPEKLIPLLQTFYAGGWIAIMAATAYRFAAVFLYLRVFGSNRKFSIAALVVLVLTFIFMMLQGLLWTFFQCTPVRKAWDPTVPGHCHDLIPYYIVSQSVSAGVDIVVLLLPMPMIKSLDLKLSQKLWLALVFVLGYIVAVIPLVRTGVFAKYAWVLTSEDPDFTWNTPTVDYLIILEPAVAVVGLCSPPIYQLVVRVKNSGLRALFYAYPYPSKTGDETEEEGETPRFGLSRSSTEPNRHLVEPKHPGQARPSADDVALNSILQGRNVSVTEERMNSAHSRGRVSSAHDEKALPPGHV